MAKVTVVYHSGYGHTKYQAEAVYNGASAIKNIEAKLININDIEQHWDDLHNADAIIFGAPTYMGSLSGDFKKFMDATSKIWFKQKWKDKLAAGFSNSSNMSGDKLNSLLQLVIFAGQHGMNWVSLGLLGDPGPNVGQKDHINRIGSFIGAMAQSDHDSAKPSDGDLETARLLGARVAEAALRWKK